MVGEPKWISCIPYRHKNKKHYTDHTGKHDDVMGLFVNHHLFPRILNEVHSYVAESLRSGAPTITMAFWCTHGKHRSVCGAELFGQVLRRVLVNADVTIQHLTQELWQTYRWRNCYECRYPKLTYVPRVVQLWRDKSRNWL